MHSNYTCFQDQLSVIHNRKTNTITQCIFGINFCRQFYMLVEAGTAMLSIDHQGEDKSCSDDHFWIPLPMLNSIILHLGCKGKRKLLRSIHRTVQRIHITVPVSYIQDEQDIFSMTSRHEATWSKFCGEKKRPLWSIHTGWYGFSGLAHDAHCPCRAEQSHSPHCEFLHPLERNRAERWVQPATSAANSLLLPSFRNGFL